MGSHWKGCLCVGLELLINYQWEFYCRTRCQPARFGNKKRPSCECRQRSHHGLLVGIPFRVPLSVKLGCLDWNFNSQPIAWHWCLTKYKIHPSVGPWRWACVGFGAGRLARTPYSACTMDQLTDGCTYLFIIRFFLFKGKQV